MQFLRLLLVVTVSAFWASAQQPVYTLKVDVPLVSVDAVVLEADGRVATSLNAEDFLIYEDGVPQPIRYFSPAISSYSILLLFDRSASTQSRQPLMLQAVAEFLGNLRIQDRLAIAAFDEEFQMLTTWKEKGPQNIEMLGRLLQTRPQYNGITFLYRSLERAIDRGFRDINGRRALIVLTDGRDESLYRLTVSTDRVPGFAEDRTFQRSLAAVREKQLAIYFIAVNTDMNLDSNEPGTEYTHLQRLFPKSSRPIQFLEQARLRMEEIAGATGGRVFLPNRIEDIVPLYNQISRDLSTSYSLGYEPLNKIKDGRTRKIEVRVAGAGRKVSQSRAAYRPW